MSPLVIDAEELVMALESYLPESSYFLDLETGEVLFLSEVDPDEELQEKLDDDPERYVRIEPVPSHVGWQVMRDFVDSLPEGQPKEQLARAIERSRPFRRFKDELLDYPSVREEWFRFHESAFMQLAREWLQEEGIEAELKLRPGGQV